MNPKQFNILFTLDPSIKIPAHLSELMSYYNLPALMLTTEKYKDFACKLLVQNLYQEFDKYGTLPEHVHIEIDFQNPQKCKIRFSYITDEFRAKPFNQY